MPKSVNHGIDHCLKIDFDLVKQLKGGLQLYVLLSNTRNHSLSRGPVSVILLQLQGVDGLKDLRHVAIDFRRRVTVGQNVEQIVN